MIRLSLSALTVRLLDILQIRFSPLFAEAPPTSLEMLSPASRWRRLLKVAGYTVVRLVGNIFKPVRNSDRLEGAVWLYVVSQNNVEALRFLAKDTTFRAVFVAGQGKNIGRYNRTTNRLSLRRKILYYWQLPIVFWGLLRTQRKATWRFFDLVFVAIGYYEVYRRTLRHYRPQAVIFSNDHNDDARAMLLACRAEAIPTAYIQHASVSQWFPPLDFDLSMLEGQHALDTYRLCGPIRGRVSLVGMPKLDPYILRRNYEPTVTRVGIAANLLDSTEALINTIESLTQSLPNMIFTLRPHPSDPRDFKALFTTRIPRLRFSNARQENIFEFLSCQDALIAAETSTHLEATLLNICSLYFRFNSGYALSYDYYGYVRNGVVDAFDTIQELNTILTSYSIRKPHNIYQRATYYCSTVGTAAEGHSEELARTITNEWVNKNT